MNWINPPERIRRFTVNQLAQHWLAVGIAGALWASAAALSVRPAPGWAEAHVTAGYVACALFAYHLVALAAIGIRQNTPIEDAACIPARRRAGGERGAASRGKYSSGERGDYVAILAWTIPVAATGLVLRWPGRFGVPGPQVYAWVRVLHAAFGAAWTVHILVHHVPGRWLRASGAQRNSIIYGYVPLDVALSRPGWIDALVREGILVPVPEERVPEDVRESGRARAALEEGNRLAREGRYEEACAGFEEALRLYPEYSQARFNLGVARLRQGKRDEAAEQLRKFLEDDPFNPMAERAKQLLEDIGGDSQGGSW